MQTKYQLIETEAALCRLTRRLEKQPAVAVDLEADSMYHYHEKVCLLQLAFPGEAAIVDPLKVASLAPLKPFLADERIVKIFHGADYDMRSLYRDFEIEVHGLFDTELACRFLGWMQTGLEKVVLDKTGVKLDKKYQKKDWSQRPLPDAMMRYAARDVICLFPLLSLLQMDLVHKDRLEWVIEECRWLSRVRAAARDGRPLFVRFKGAGRLDRRTLAVLEEVLCLRDEIARRKDRPVFKIMGNAALKTIAERKPQTAAQLDASRALSPKQVAMYGHGVLRAVGRAMRIPKDQLPRYPRQRKPTLPLAVSGRIKVLKVWRDETADRLQIDPGLLCNKALLGAIALKKPQSSADLKDIDGMRQWQRREFGPKIIELMKSVR